MKLFKFDTVSGKRGEFIADVEYCHGCGNRQGASATLPKVYGQEWMVATEASNRKGEQYINYPFAVCFCLGKFSCGDTSAWDWVVLLPRTE